MTYAGRDKRRGFDHFTSHAAVGPSGAQEVRIGLVRLAYLEISHEPRPMGLTCTGATTVRLDCVESDLCPA
jgi:hypothetical protein